MNNIKLSRNFWLGEALFSEWAKRHAVDNEPTPEIMANIKWAAQNMEYVREFLGNKPIQVTSWYRCEVVNAAIGGARLSEHLLGLAIDFTCRPYGTPHKICLDVAASELDYHQLIYEYGEWVHISFPAPGIACEREEFTKIYGKAYVKGISVLA